MEYGNTTDVCPLTYNGHYHQSRSRSSWGTEKAPMSAPVHPRNVSLSMVFREDDNAIDTCPPVSYTHLTLPTIYSV